ncbi:PepSY domain-containing protein [Rhizobium terricola]|nr:PepSY domain-containing protein [Rhizobium terricola]
MAMRTVLTATMIALLTGTALAEDDCNLPMATWQPREAVRAMAEARGWRLQRIKIDDGCYEIHALDANGQRFEAKIDPATLQIIEIEHEREHGHR